MILGTTPEATATCIIEKIDYLVVSDQTLWLHSQQRIFVEKEPVTER